MTPNQYRPTIYGAEGVTRALAPKLAAGARDMIERIRNQTGATEAELPYFTEIAVPPRTLTAIGEYPIVMLKVVSTTGRLDNRNDAGTGIDDVYHRVYRIRAIVLTLANTIEAGELQTQRLGLAVRDGILLDRLLVDSNAEGKGPSIEVLTQDIAESYDEIVPTSSGFLGGAEVTFNVKAREIVVTGAAYRGELPALDDVNIEVFRFPGDQ